MPFAYITNVTYNACVIQWWCITDNASYTHYERITQSIRYVFPKHCTQCIPYALSTHHKTHTQYISDTFHVMALTCIWNALCNACVLPPICIAHNASHIHYTLIIKWMPNTLMMRYTWFIIMCYIVQRIHNASHMHFKRNIQHMSNALMIRCG